jgi:hypothetical protein
MTIRPCRTIRPDGKPCGLTPTVQVCAPHKLRVECACGAHGVAISYNFPEQMRKVAQAAVDGWNLADT